MKIDRKKFSVQANGKKTNGFEVERASVTITHISTGQSVTCSSERGQSKNEKKAMRMLLCNLEDLGIEV